MKDEVKNAETQNEGQGKKDDKGQTYTLTDVQEMINETAASFDKKLKDVQSNFDRLNTKYQKVSGEKAELEKKVMTVEEIKEKEKLEKLQEKEQELEKKDYEIKKNSAALKAIELCTINKLPVTEHTRELVYDLDPEIAEKKAKKLVEYTNAIKDEVMKSIYKDNAKEPETGTGKEGEKDSQTVMMDRYKNYTRGD